MPVTLIPSLQYLNWNSDNKCFEILDSTDRKIISFLFDSVMPTCYSFRERSLPTYDWSEKGLTYFKPLFLKKIDFAFQSHILNCPIEEYRQTLISFYEGLKQKINDFSVDSTVSKKAALLSLQKVCTDCFINLFNKPPLNMPQLHFRDLSEQNKEYLNALDQGQCYHYAFYLAKEYKTMMSMIPFESSCNAAFLLYPKYFLQGIGYSETNTPANGDLVLYLGDPKLHNNARFKHLGMLTDKGTIKSCWGNFACQFEHQISQVPNAYGSEVVFFHKTSLHPENFDKIIHTTNQMSNLIVPFNSQTIPSPLTNLGALFFFFDQLKSECKRAMPNSEQWDWGKIKQNLLETVNYSRLKRTELNKEFQFWAQEILPQYFIKLS